MLINHVYSLMNKKAIPNTHCSVFCHHVLLKMADSFGREITLTTLEGLFSRVLALVYIRTTSLSARMIALIAFVGLLSSVSALVFFQMRSSSAWMVALIAFEWLFSWMDLDMIFEITISWIGEATLWAAEGLFSGVLELVSFQMNSLSACIDALITIKRFFSWMGSNVIFEITSCCAGEATLRAAVKLFSLINQHVSWDEKIMWRSNYIACNGKVFLPEWFIMWLLREEDVEVE